MSYSTARAALATALGAVSGVTVYDRPPAATPAVPAAWVQPGETAVLYGQTFGGSSAGAMDLRFRVVVVVGRSADDSLAFDGLDPYLAGSGATSIPAALEAASGVAFARVVSAEVGFVEVAGVQYLAASFITEVTAS